MKLLVYDHCPYCTRARAIIGYRKLEIETVYVANHDHETPEGLIGKKMVPILIKEDGSAMGESLDIVAYLESTYHPDDSIDENVRPELEEWISQNHRLVNYLMMPRCVQIGLEEFEEQAAIDYFVHKKEDYIGSFKEHLEKTDEYIENLEAAFDVLDKLVTNTYAFYNDFSYEDILIFPILRNLTMVQGLTFPDKLKTYVETLSNNLDIPLFFDRSI